MNNQPIYNQNDYTVRFAVAASGAVKLAVDIAKGVRAGSADVCSTRKLEMVLCQLNCIRGYKVLQTSAKGIFKPLSNTGADITTELTINGIVVSSPFLFTNTLETTIENTVKAVNEFTSIPNYTATTVGDEVHITADTKGQASNGLVIDLSVNPTEVTFSTTYLFGGQDGVDPEDNILSEEQLHNIFTNIADTTECGYAPLGTTYTTK